MVLHSVQLVALPKWSVAPVLRLGQRTGLVLGLVQQGQVQVQVQRQGIALTVAALPQLVASSSSLPSTRPSFALVRV